MKKKSLLRVISCLLIAVLIFYGNSGVTAKAADTVGLVVSETMEEIELVPGTTTHIKVPVKSASSENFLTNVTASVSVSGEGSSSSFFKVKNISFNRPDAVDSPNVITYFSTTYIEFDIITKETATIGQYSINITCNNMHGLFTTTPISIPCFINNELQPTEITVTNFNYLKDTAIIGNDLDLNLMVKNEGEIKALNTYVSVDYGEQGLKANYTTSKIKLGDMAAGASQSVKLPISILKDAKVGTKKLVVNFAYKDADGTSHSDSTELYVDVISNEAAPKLDFTDAEFQGELLVGNDFKVVATLKNTGNSKAENIKVKVTEGISATTIMPDYTLGYVSAGNLKKNSSEQVEIPLTISKDAVKGTTSVKIEASYEDANGASYTATTTVYPVIKANEDIKKEEGAPNIIINNVTQSPAKPSAGEQVSISFDLENKSKIDATELKVATTGLTADTFSPITQDPYIYLDELKAGTTKHITMVFDVSKSIAEGYNTIPLTYSYKYGENNTEDSKNTTLNVLNVINDLDDLSKSVPKLIISNHSTDVEAIKAGQTFNFTYDIKNTHNSVSAKNIKVTITQADNIFSVTDGSNSSYIEQIKPGEVQTCTLELKVKADATTKAYPLTITMSYEYDGATVSPVTGKLGEEVTESINLQAVENCRPELVNTYVDNYSTPTVGEPTILYFDFYNMGKSPLCNVYATISGDFSKSDGDKTMIGNVNSGECQNVEVDVTPLIEGEATGVITITFEDSNGEEMTMTQEFTSYVQGAYNYDDMGGMDYTDTMAPVVKAKKPILPLWAFIGVQVVIFFIVTFATKGIIIKHYKRKLEKAEEEN